MKENKNENVCERNFYGRFSRELCWEIVQQFTSEGPIIVSEGYPTYLPLEGSPIYLPNLGSKLSRTKNFCFENWIFYSHSA